jgi:hypothetical protein
MMLPNSDIEICARLITSRVLDAETKRVIHMLLLYIDRYDLDRVGERARLIVENEVAVPPNDEPPKWPSSPNDDHNTENRVTPDRRNSR